VQIRVLSSIEDKEIINESNKTKYLDLMTFSENCEIFSAFAL
jgi:hypothetical protein